MADEINREPAKGQSALLEAMAEKQVTIGDKTYKLPEPFFVLATQNPIDQEGTYNLPEAELDRFLLKLQVPYPTPEQELIIAKNGGVLESVPLKKVFSAESLMKCRKLLNEVTCTDAIIEYIVSIITVTRPVVEKKQVGGRPVANAKNKDDILKYISFGASPRASIAMVQCAKAAALFAGRDFVLPEDIKAVAHDVLRHRLVLSYEASADGITSDDLISKILALMPVP